MGGGCAASDAGAYGGSTGSTYYGGHSGFVGVPSTSVGVGADFDWCRMDQLADAGKGTSVFLTDAEEALRMFATEQFTKLVEIAADEVDVELEVPVGLQHAAPRPGSRGASSLASTMP